MWWLLIIALLLLGVFVYYYNNIIRLSNQIDNAYSIIKVQLKRRADLVPALVETIKGYVKHERGVFNDVVKARERMMSAKSINDKIKANNDLTSALKSLIAISESYPKLRANKNFLQLQEELASIENKIAYARQFYNDMVLKYNNLITTIPGKFFAGNRKVRQYLDLKVSDERVKISF